MEVRFFGVSRRPRQEFQTDYERGKIKFQVLSEEELTREALETIGKIISDNREEVSEESIIGCKIAREILDKLEIGFSAVQVEGNANGEKWKIRLSFNPSAFRN